MRPAGVLDGSVALKSRAERRPADVEKGKRNRPVDGDALTRWSARASLALCAVALTVLPWRDGRFARACWAAGWLALAAHVAFAFHHHHHWSHAEAVAHVERRSGFGPGLFFSYLLALLWALDVAWWGASPASHARRPAWVGGVLFAYFAFMAFNATVVYEAGAVRVAGLIGTGAVALSVALRMRRKR